MASSTSSTGDHYGGGSPLDGGGNPGDLGGQKSKISTSALEIGLIVGVVCIVLITLVWLFIWRSRKNRAAKNAANAENAQDDDDGRNPFETNEIHEPVPLPKDEQASTIDKDESSSIERPLRSHKRPIAHWNHWINRAHRPDVEEHEIANRV
ncbi:hypothetical protein F4778DRAFT_397623 [Xylariomycetidae sp. FL2044]|nr:hypothetical protein F4778DRAFT_397623 [Xylariomycetidae sp. FL2044]